MSARGDQSLRHRHPSSPAPVIHLSRSSSTDSLSEEDQSESHLSLFELPQFTIKELYAAIPSHCFERSAVKSSLYLVWDLFLSATLIYLAGFIDPYCDANHHLLASVHTAFPSLARFTAWAIYGYVAGLVWTGLWVIAHECGHQAFSASKTLNSTIGWFLHSALLVPYASWRITHAQHHAGTGHMTRDQVFVPKTRSQLGLSPLKQGGSKDERDGAHPASIYDKVDDLLEDAPLWNFITLVLQQFLGWPGYLLINSSGQPEYPPWTNHFNPGSIVFDARHRSQVLLSDLAIGLVLATLTYIGYQTSFMALFKYYIVPYLWVNHWLVLFTAILHTDPKIPRYRDGAYNFQRGALCTFDRSIHGFFFHGIAETHVVHHLFSKIPHYHAWEATQALKKKIGHHYHQSDENYWVTLWKNHIQCRFVEDEGDVVFFKNAKGQAAMRLAKDKHRDSISDSGVDVSDAKQKVTTT